MPLLISFLYYLLVLIVFVGERSRFPEVYGETIDLCSITVERERERERERETVKSSPQLIGHWVLYTPSALRFVDLFLHTKITDVTIKLRIPRHALCIFYTRPKWVCVLILQRI